MLCYDEVKNRLYYIELIQSSIISSFDGDVGVFRTCTQIQYNFTGYTVHANKILLYTLG